MYFAFYNVTSIHGFTSMVTVICEKNRILWVFPTASKISPSHIIGFILTTLNNEQQLLKHIRIDEYSVLKNSTDVTNLLVESFKISMETTGSDASCLNVKNKIHNRSIHNMVIAGFFYINKHVNKW